MKKNLQRFGASVLAAAMVAQSVALPAAAETTKIDSSVAQSVAASAASAASAVQSLPKFTSTADLIKQTAQTLAAQGEVHELEQDDAKLEATAQSKAGMSLAALENALADAMYANAAAGKINTEAYGLNKDEMASVMAATIKTYHLSSAVTDLGYETNAAGVVTAVTFTGSSGMTSAMESMTNSDDEVIAQQADSYAQAYVAENSDTFAASAAADGHTYGEPKWYWNDTNPEDGHTHTWKETPDGYWTKTDDGWAYTAVYTCEKNDAYQKVEGTVTKDTTEAKPGVAGKTVVGRDGEDDRALVAQVGLGGHGDAGVGDAGGQLAQGVAGAGCDQQYIQQLFRTDGFGLGQGVPNLTTADFLDAAAKLLRTAKAGIGFIGVWGQDGIQLPAGLLRHLFHLKFDRNCHGVSFFVAREVEAFSVARMYKVPCGFPQPRAGTFLLTFLSIQPMFCCLWSCSGKPVSACIGPRPT